jgi:RNA polymerase sigma-70 factor, ECF subfamily
VDLTGDAVTNSNEHDDKRLVRRLLDGDDDAFEEFFEAMYPALYRFALARLEGQREAAEDVAQTTLLRAMGKLGTYRGEASLLTWLCTFSRHEIFAYTKAHRHVAKAVPLDDAPEIRAALESLHAAADGTDPHLALDRQQQASLIQRVLDQLPAHYGSVLEWKYIDEFPVRDIAERLGIRIAAAESLLARARRAFRDALLAVSPVLTLDGDSLSRVLEDRS